MASPRSEDLGHPSNDRVIPSPTPPSAGWGTRAIAWLSLALVLLVTQGARGQTVLCVDARGPDGSPWPQVHTHLQDALAEAALIANEESVEIWVAAGVYKPDEGVNQTRGDRDASFDLVSNVALYGGFAGGETEREQRNWVANETILSGDLAGDDDPDVVPSSTCCTDTWEPGCDDEPCEALVVDVEPDCAQRWASWCASSARRRCCDLCRPSRCDNTYRVITAVDTDSTVVLDGFTIMGAENNQTEYPLELGGGFASLDSSPTVNNCVFAYNGGGYGPAMYAARGEPTVTKSAFDGNTAYGSGYVLSFRWNEATVTNCSFTENRGGGLLIDGSKPIVGCRFAGNARGGLLISHGSPDVIDSLFLGNSAKYDGGGAINFSTARFINCGFYGNSAGNLGGGLYSSGDGVTLINCVFSGNTAGGLVEWPGAPPQPGTGGAFYAQDANVDIVNCTAAGNHAGRVGGMSSFFGPTIINSIFWGNTADSGSVEQAQFRNSTDAVARISYTSIQGWTPHWRGHQTASTDPLFVDPLGPDGIAGTLDDDLRLSPNSPLINLGDPGFVLEPGSTDLDGNPRLQGCRVDMGAYEANVSRVLGDFDGNNSFDLADLAGFQACTGMGSPTSEDVGHPGNPAWLDACLCVFDYDDNSQIDLADFTAFHEAFVNP